MQVNSKFETSKQFQNKAPLNKSTLIRSTCVSRCPPRSFPNQGGVCWPCHESCETCAGAGQDSCLTCAPAHLHVTDLAVCLQQCPDGYYESEYHTFAWSFYGHTDYPINLCSTALPNYYQININEHTFAPFDSRL